MIILKQACNNFSKKLKEQNFLEEGIDLKSSGFIEFYNKVKAYYDLSIDNDFGLKLYKKFYQLKKIAPNSDNDISQLDISLKQLTIFLEDTLKELSSDKFTLDDEDSKLKNEFNSKLSEFITELVEYRKNNKSHRTVTKGFGKALNSYSDCMMEILKLSEEGAEDGENWNKVDDLLNNLDEIHSKLRDDLGELSIIYKEFNDTMIVFNEKYDNFFNYFENSAQKYRKKYVSLVKTKNKNPVLWALKELKTALQEFKIGDKVNNIVEELKNTITALNKDTFIGKSQKKAVKNTLKQLSTWISKQHNDEKN